MSELDYNYHSLSEIASRFDDPDLKVISFDMFDTLVVRPLEHASDLFELLDVRFRSFSTSRVSFLKLRKEAEAVLRRQIIDGLWDAEDVTLDDIYLVLVQEFHLGPEVADAMQKYELELEMQLCVTRHSGRFLFEQALASGKKVVVTSDMYLSPETLRSILIKNGYPSDFEVFVSSDIGKRKLSGGIYDELISRLGVAPAGIMHIGDHERHDCAMAASRGIITAWLPSSLGVFNAHGCSTQVEKICSDLTNWEAARTSMGIGAFRAMAAHKYFDDPFRPFDESTDYNCDPYFVGYAALGPQLLALTRWMADSLVRDHADHMVFLARDGFMPRKFYDAYRDHLRTYGLPGASRLPESSYLHVSRLSLLPLIIKDEHDLWDLPVDLNYQTPRKLMKLLQFCHNKKVNEAADLILGFPADETLTTRTYQKFISAFITDAYHTPKHLASKKRVSDYLRSHIPSDGRTAFFDMGYSGRIAAAIIDGLSLSDDTDYSPVFYYFHSDARSHFHYAGYCGLTIRSFFDFNLYMESSLREYAYLETTASCIGYDDRLEPVWDAGPAPGYETTVSGMQAGAIDFMNDFHQLFGTYSEAVTFRYHEAALPFEAFLRYCCAADREMFRNIFIDDELWGGRRDIELKYLMESRLSKIPDYARRNDE